MGLSLMVQPALNVSASPLNFPPLRPPDIYNCNDWYSSHSEAQLSDCRVAFDALPRGNAPIPWYNEPAAGQQRNLLPLDVHHGTCQIIFHTSGQSAKNADPIYIVPNQIRGMADWVMKSCGKGGMVTKGIEKTINPLLDTRTTVFPNPSLPPSSTFYSLHIWNYLRGVDIDWNPGDMDPDVGGALERKVLDAIGEAQPGSPRRTELTRRYHYLDEAVHAMDWDEPPINWYDGPRARGSTSNANRLALNGTGGSREVG